eukprot:CAMPEP_0206611764 /NCGR_PEP_ID=MMETSP0325_2-20121206/55512_1 /ASSEMBLY_ACC=CAM_ASM_000347 /TAXON_ID=2866 /ORGANISM="Crypthecodinium cohnii, Strain Seligo" /LENGTH=77 /DNA_ID=CAMNT_0054131175 /DNA_START=422 /DNA_END=655 /DNA_ORIENTATION=-
MFKDTLQSDEILTLLGGSLGNNLIQSQFGFARQVKVQRKSLDFPIFQHFALKGACGHLSDLLFQYQRGIFLVLQQVP